MKLEPTTLAIFDYSGTLSLGAVKFGQAGNLERHLTKSGLARIGIDTSERYWDAVVNPTWARASTSAAGFLSITAERIRGLAIPGTSSMFVEAAVSKFMAAYMHHSNIDAGWRPLLADIEVRPDTLCLIATDHYAEATEAIRTHLADLGIPSTPIARRKMTTEKPGFMVANSADIGYAKASNRFWQAVRNACPTGPLKQLLLVDDFGVNEQSASDYPATGPGEDRIQATRQALDDVFGPDSQIIHFIAGGNPEAAIAAAGQAVRKALQI